VYVPASFQTKTDEAWGVVSDAGAGALVLAGPAGLLSVVVPVVVSEDRRTITSHVAKANPWWKAVEPDSHVLGIFLVASAYVTPSYYPSRLANPGVVPTWNYVAAEVRGRVRLHEEAEWKLDQVRSQTERFEHGRDPEWRLEEAPTSYLDHQVRAIVGIEIEVLSIEGMAKLSQNRPTEDRDHVREALANGSLAERIVARRMPSDE
jgi:transcriptional regulator